MRTALCIAALTGLAGIIAFVPGVSSAPAASRLGVTGTGGKLINVPTVTQISSSAGGARAHALSLPGLTAELP